MRKPLAILALATLLFAGAGCGTPQLQPISLTYWRAEDSPDALAEIITDYRKQTQLLHPNITVTVTSFPSDTYLTKLTEALAEDRGPDMFSIPNAVVRGWKDRLAPIPKETVILGQTVNDAKQIVLANIKTPGLTVRRLVTDYAEAVQDDVVMSVPGAKPTDPPQDQIFGLPYSLDTLGLFYNRELLKKAGIEKPPADWQDFQDQVQKLTVRGDSGITQSGAGLGLASNVPHATDILLTMMLQFGAPLDSKPFPNFSSVGPGGSRFAHLPAVEAVYFYQKFARPGDDSFTWDAKLPSALDAFLTGKTAFYFGYPSELLTVRERAPQLDVGVAAMPQDQLYNPASIANYPVETVSKKSRHPNEAWDFIQFAASKDEVSKFDRATNRPTALRALMNNQVSDPEVGPFVKQALTAKSWYFGKDYPKAFSAMTDLVEAKPDLLSNITMDILVSNAEGKVRGTW